VPSFTEISLLSTEISHHVNLVLTDSRMAYPKTKCLSPPIFGGGGIKVTLLLLLFYCHYYHHNHHTILVKQQPWLSG